MLLSERTMIVFTVMAKILMLMSLGLSLWGAGLILIVCSTLGVIFTRCVGVSAGLVLIHLSDPPAAAAPLRRAA